MANTENTLASIGKAVSIKGEIFSNEDLYVDGALEGNKWIKKCRQIFEKSVMKKKNWIDMFVK